MQFSYAAILLLVAQISALPLNRADIAIANPIPAELHSSRDQPSIILSKRAYPIPITGLNPPVTYDPNSILGEGNSGIVYNGEQNGKPVAVKTIHWGSNGGLEKAYQISQRLPQNHPNLMRVIGVGKTPDDSDALVTDKYSGTNMEDLAKSRYYQQNPEVLKQHVVDRFNGLAAFQRAGIQHGSAHYANNVVDDNNRVRIVDYDDAKPVGTTTGVAEINNRRDGKWLLDVMHNKVLSDDDYYDILNAKTLQNRQKLIQQHYPQASDALAKASSEVITWQSKLPASQMAHKFSRVPQFAKGPA